MEIIVSTADQKRLNPIYVPLNLCKNMYKIPETHEHELVKLLFENVKYSETKKEFEFQHQELERNLNKVLDNLQN